MPGGRGNIPSRKGRHKKDKHEKRRPPNSKPHTKIDRKHKKPKQFSDFRTEEYKQIETIEYEETDLPNYHFFTNPSPIRRSYDLTSNEDIKDLAKTIGIAAGFGVVCYFAAPVVLTYTGLELVATGTGIAIGYTFTFN